MAYRKSAETGEPELAAEELELLRDILPAMPEAGKIVELGTAAGGTAIEMLRALPQTEHSRFVVIDPFRYFTDHRAIWEKNLRGAGLDPAAFTVLEQTSASARKVFRERDEPIAFILIDARHKLKDVISDVCWASFVVPGGMIAFHDYHPDYPGVKRAVDLFLERNPNYEVTAQAGSLLVVRKLEENQRHVMPWPNRLWWTGVSVLHQWRASIAKRFSRSRG